MSDIEFEYNYVLDFFEKLNLKETNEQVIKEKIELAKSTISDMNNKIIKIKKESKIKNFFITIFTFGKINKNKENRIKIMQINKKISKLWTSYTTIKWNLILKKQKNNDNDQKLKNAINNWTEDNKLNNWCSMNTKSIKGVI